MNIAIVREKDALIKEALNSFPAAMCPSGTVFSGFHLTISDWQPDHWRGWLSRGDQKVEIAITAQDIMEIAFGQDSAQGLKVLLVKKLGDGLIELDKLVRSSEVEAPEGAD